MNDAEFIFRETERERKRIAQGDKHKKRGGGRYVRLPSDNLSRKERQAMNGEVISFDPRKFYTWEEFKTFPDDLQLKYVNSLVNRYGVGVQTISEIVFKKSGYTLGSHLKAKGLIGYVNKVKSNPNNATAKAKLRRDVENIATGIPEIDAEANLPAQDDVLTIDAGNDTPESENQISRLSELLRLLSGTGAKLTIEVTL